MAGFDGGEAVLRAAFASAWNASTIPVEYENSGEWQPPHGRWVRWCFRIDAAVQAAMGTPLLKRYMGHVLVQAFTPRSSGTAPLSQMGDAVRGIYDGKKVGGLVQCRISVITIVGADRNYYQANITTPFVFHGTD